MRNAFKEEKNVFFKAFSFVNFVFFLKKRYEGQLQSYLSQQLNIDQLAFTKENIQNNIETVFLKL